MNLQLYIGLKYIRAKKKDGFVSFISAISIAGVAIGVMTLIVVISVMDGFSEELKKTTLESVPHAIISSSDKSNFSNWKETINVVENITNVIGVSPYVTTEVMIKGRGTTIVLLTGVLPDYEEQVTKIHQKMTSGQFSDLTESQYNIIIGSKLAEKLDKKLNEIVTIFIPKFNQGHSGMSAKIKKFTIVGIFNIGSYEYDSRLAFIHLSDAQDIKNLGNRIHGIRIETNNIMNVAEIANDINNKIGGLLRIRDWTQENSNFFKISKNEKLTMFIILSMIILIAAFNILSMMMILVVDKNSEIAILRTLGMSSPQIMFIFIIVGLLIGMIGIIIGTTLGLIISINISSIVDSLEVFFNKDFMSSDVYLIDKITAKIQYNEIIKIISTAFFLTIAATIYPAWRASRVQPAEALRYE